MAAVKLPIGGLKISPPLAQIVIGADARPPIAELFQQLAQRRINMTLVALESDTGEPSGTCCVDQRDLATLERLLGNERRGITIVAPVVCLTIYPHQARLALLQRVLEALAYSAVVVRAVASSLSALSVVVDGGRLETALSALAAVTELPANHAPLYATLRVYQI